MRPSRAMLAGLIGLVTCLPAQAAPGRPGAGARLPNVADILAAERYEHDYCVEQARKHPSRVTCGKSPPARISDLKCTPRESRYAICDYAVTVEDGTGWKSPNQFYAKEEGRWILKSVIRMKD